MTSAPRVVRPSAGPVDATVSLPGSKSLTNRALICAALAGGGRIEGALDADDTQAMVGCLRTLGWDIDWSGPDTIDVRRREAIPPRPLDARQSGTTARFVLPILALDDRPWRLGADAQMTARPMDPTLAAVRSLGARVETHERDGHLPATVQGPITHSDVAIPADASSQFLSGLLMVGPCLDAGLSVRITTGLVSEPYVAMTVAVMQEFGASVEIADEIYRVAPGGYRPADYRVEPDASAASYILAAAAISGGRATVRGLAEHSIQGDVAFARVLEKMGATVQWGADHVTVVGGPLHGVDVDMNEITDTVPTLAVVAAQATGPTRIRGAGFIRHKESDRIGGVIAELARVGVRALEHPDGMTIHPGPIRPATLESYGDHRMAMAMSLLALSGQEMRIADPECVAKTFPGWWDVLHNLLTGRYPPANVD